MNRAVGPARLLLTLLAGSALSTPAFAQAAGQPVTASAEQPADDGQEADSTEIVVTAQKREENLQDVPVSIQAIGTRRLDQLNISNFEDYTKQLPSVSYQTAAPGSTVVYMRGVASGGDGNHSGSLPSVGTYLDEQPVTTIGGTLDVHIYDIARIESLAGPQGTLYGASSQAGTIRIITNKPELGVTAGRLDAEVNTVHKGGFGGSLEGMINLPIADNIAFRGIAFWRHDGGYIDNILGSRTYESAGGDLSFTNAALVDDDINGVRTYGGRAALKIDLDENWTVLPQVMHQNQKADGVFFYDPDLGDLKAERFFEDKGRDEFTQAALTITGKVFNFDLTYSGAYLDRPTYSFTDYTDYTDAYDSYYIACCGTPLLDYQTYVDNAGNTIDPRQFIEGTNHFKKLSQEVRLSSPADRPFRVIVGGFYQRQTNDIYQNYLVARLADNLSVPGYPGTIWLTKQERVDKDYALFGEASFDVTPQITLTGGGRLFRFDNTLFGFAGFGPGNPGGFSSGYRRCLTVNGLQLRNDPTSPLAQGGVDGTPCTNVGNVVDGKLVPRRSKGDGFTHRVNAQYKPTEDLMFYATWSRGFRPGGINRQPNSPAYDPDYLVNYELGWKATLANGRVRFNGAVYHQKWEAFQFSFLGENSLTVIQNGRDADINGIETDISYVGGGLTLNAAAAYTDAKAAENICDSILDDAACSDSFIVAPKGTRLPVTPRFKAAATARYAWPVGPGRAHVQGGLSYQSSAGTDIRQDADGGGTNPNDFLGRLRSYALADVFAGYSWGRFNIEGFATNLFDKRNDISRSVGCSICVNTRIYPGRPRTIGLRFGTRF
ncbi:TonB-dependent receptor [Sphingomonas sp. LHG3406-1]|uniref:TonB-dependent receptor n=1 Tax=Sphingomonas sp. LHG3406-1 TaxID=2804617 RepID=UPI00260CB54D|nr:TonB-dependent receptor [Sphingomonas sp. LHG3406-1]